MLNLPRIVYDSECVLGRQGTDCLNSEGHILNCYDLHVQYTSYDMARNICLLAYCKYSCTALKWI